jgi:putative ubiquitin-RnfH superfamily antitoxin RatB of RatAB toxin-antitoxin module
MASRAVQITVVYALPDRQSIVQLDVPEGTTVVQAVELSQLASRFPEIGASALNCAIFGQVVATSHSLHAGDRVEVLRPLLIDPKESRRQAAAQARRRK